MERRERCQDCVCLIEDENGNWVCEELGKRVIEIPDEMCPENKK